MHENLKRFNVVVAHRRFGKTVWCVNELIKKAMGNKLKRPQYAYLAPTQKQAKLIVWKYIKEFTAVIPGVNYNEAELRCELPNGATLFVLGAENPDSLRGIYLDGVVMDEVAQMPQAIWGEVLRPALADRKGWAIFIGTPKGKNYFHKLYQTAISDNHPEWAGFLYKASYTKLLDSEELESLRAEMTPEEYEQEMECSFHAAIKGAYYGKILAQLDHEGGIGKFPYQKDATVTTAWDIGINDKTCIWFTQKIDNEIHVVDYYENSDMPLTHYVNVIQGKNYVYDMHILPHDIKQRNFSTGDTRLDELQRYGLRCQVAPKLPIMDGINAVRSIIPMCRFNVGKVQEGLEALYHYCSNFNEKLGVQQQTPKHDWSSHAADAFRYLAIGMRPVRKQYTDSMLEYDGFDPLK